MKSIVTQVGSALAAAHREGVVHRDLKPDNVFLCPTDLGGEVRDVVKVLDFGISKIRGSNTVLTQDAALLGTPQYMAPEQATGRNDEIDARTDVFAFGAMTFEMLAGKPPFTGDTLAAVIHAIVYAPTPPLATLAKETPPAIVAAIERAMEKNRDARFPDVNSFVKAVTSRSLATAPGTEQVPARPATVAATERISREPSRTPVYITFGDRRRGGARPSRSGSCMPREPEEAALPPQTAEHVDDGREGASPRPRRRPRRRRTTPTPPGEHEARRADAGGEADRAEAGARRGKADGRQGEGDRAARPRRPAISTRPRRRSTAASRPMRVRLAQHSLYAQKSSRAYAVIARARCAQGDLGNAKAALAQVAARDRSPVVRACGKLGVELR